MTNEELVRLIRDGHTELMAQLWDQVRAFVYKQAISVIRKMPPGCGVAVEDLSQCGYIALDSAVRTYDESKGSLLTWLDYYLKSEFNQAAGLRNSRRDPLLTAASLDAPLSADDESGSLMDTVPDPDENGSAYAEVDEKIYQEQLHAVLDNAIDTLPTAQAAALRGKYWEDKSRSTLAEECGVTEACIRSAERAGLRRLRSPAYFADLAQFLEDRTDYYRGGGLRSFNATGGSSVENIVARREELSQKWNQDRSRAQHSDRVYSEQPASQ